MNTESVLFALLRSEICGMPVRDAVKDALSPEMIEGLYKLSYSHDLAHIVGQALSKLGALGSDETSKKLKTLAVQAAFRYVGLNREYLRICTCLEKAKIPFIPLKGSVSRDWYPEPWMRTSCDIDVLVEEARLDEGVAALTQGLNFRYEEKGDHDVSLLSPNNVHLELHYDTVQQRYADDRRRAVLAGVWKDAMPKAADGYHRCMSDAMFYYYHMAHMAKHFETGGCGIRPFMDIWIMNHRLEFDPEKRRQLLERGDLLRFAQAAEQLAEHWFSDAPADAMTAQLEEYIIRGGVYGNDENRAAVGQAKMGGKLRYVLLRRVFMPYDYLKAEYPVLQRHKWLTPVYQVVRWFRMVFKGQTRRTLTELRSNTASTKEERAEAQALLDHLGL